MLHAAVVTLLKQHVCMILPPGYLMCTAFFFPIETLIYWRRYIFKHLLCEETEIFSGYERCGFGLSGKIECPPPTNQSPTLDILSLGWTVALLCCSVKLVLEFVLFRHQVNMTGCKSVNFSINCLIYFSKRLKI